MRYGRSIYWESIKYSFLKSYGKFKMCFTCATYTDLSFIITYEIPRLYLNEFNKNIQEGYSNGLSKTALESKKL